MPEKTKPAHTIGGSVGTGLKLTLWKHESDKGPWFSATLSRSYKEGDQWRESTSCSQKDFLEISEMFRDAHAWAKEQSRTRSAQHGAEPEPAGFEAAQIERMRAGRNR